jgi:hypothetical protein
VCSAAPGAFRLSGLYLHEVDMPPMEHPDSSDIPGPATFLPAHPRKTSILCPDRPRELLRRGEAGRDADVGHGRPTPAAIARAEAAPPRSVCTPTNPYAAATLDFGIRYQRAVLKWFDALPTEIVESDRQ